MDPEYASTGWIFKTERTRVVKTGDRDLRNGALLEWDYMEEKRRYKMHENDRHGERDLGSILGSVSGNFGWVVVSLASLGIAVLLLMFT